MNKYCRLLPTFFCLLLLLSTTGCETKRARGPLTKDAVYLFEMTDANAKSNNLRTAFKGRLIGTRRTTTEDEELTIRLRSVTRKVNRSAFLRITKLND